MECKTEWNDQTEWNETMEWNEELNCVCFFLFIYLFIYLFMYYNITSYILLVSNSNPSPVGGVSISGDLVGVVLWRSQKNEMII